MENMDFINRLNEIQDIYEEDLYEDDLDMLEIIDFGFPRRLQFNRADHYRDMDELAFLRRFRLTKQTTVHLLCLIESDLEYPTDMNQSVSPINQLLACLRFYASAGHLLAVADFMKMHESTVSRIVVRVSEAIARLRPRFIKMPQTEAEIRCTQNTFYRVAGFPRVIGAIDCTHVIMDSPGGDDAELFRNRKNKFSINVQAICDANLKIQNIVARWPGSTHDATIYMNSSIRAHFENGNFSNSILLGDSGYALRSYFFTPVRNPVTQGEIRYNESHIRTRNCVERMFGVLKRRFPILAYGMRVKLETRLAIIVAVAVLHNIALEMHEAEAPAVEDINGDYLEEMIDAGQVPEVSSHENERINLRYDFINSYFANL